MDRGILILLAVVILIASCFLIFRSCGRDTACGTENVEFSFKDDTTKSVGDVLALKTIYPDTTFSEVPPSEWSYYLEGDSANLHLISAENLPGFEFKHPGKFIFVFRFTDCDKKWKQAVHVGEKEIPIGFSIYTGPETDLNKPIKKGESISFSATTSKSVNYQEIEWLYHGDVVETGKNATVITPKMKGADSISIQYEGQILATYPFNVSFEEEIAPSLKPKPEIAEKKPNAAPAPKPTPTPKPTKPVPPKPPFKGIACSTDSFQVEVVRNAVLSAFSEILTQSSAGQNAKARTTYRLLKSRYFCNNPEVGKLTFKGKSFPNLDAFYQSFILLSNESVSTCTISAADGKVVSLILN